MHTDCLLFSLKSIGLIFWYIARRNVFNPETKKSAACPDMTVCNALTLLVTVGGFLSSLNVYRSLLATVHHALDHADLLSIVLNLL